MRDRAERAATAAVAAQVTVDPGGTCQKAGIALTNVGATPIKASKAEEFLQGKKVMELTSASYKFPSKPDEAVFAKP